MRRLRSPLWALTVARVREFLREPEAIFWVFLFPVVLALALGLAFRSQPPSALPIGIESGPRAEERRTALTVPGRLAPQIVGRTEADRALRAGKLVLVVLDADPPAFLFDPTRPDSRTAELEVDAALERAAGRVDRLTPRREEVRAAGSRYVDFLLPGLLGMNLMSTGMWSIGFALVQQRSGRLLKRFVAAPVARWQLLAAHVLARFVFLALEAVALLAFGVFVLGVPVRGSGIALALLLALGALAFVGVSLLIAARPRTIEGVNGLMNLAAVPMWIGSGIFFSRERFPESLQPLLRLLPLTALNDALRAVMLEGATLASLARETVVLAAWAVVSFVLAVKIFRWD